MPIGSSPAGLAQAAHGIPPNLSAMDDPNDPMNAVDPQTLAPFATLDPNAINPEFSLMAPQPPTQVTPQEQQAFAHALAQQIAFQTIAPQEDDPAVAEALGYADAVNGPIGYGYGLNLGTPSAVTAAPDSTANALAEAQGYADSQSAPTGYGYGLSLGQQTSAPDDAAPAAATGTTGEE